MRVFSLVASLFLSVFALEIQVNFGTENNEDFSVINLKHTRPFECIEDRDIYNKVTSITCTIPQTPINNFVPSSTAFFHFSNQIQNSHLVLKFTPKYNARLFATFLDLKAQNRIPKERPKASKIWQIVGYVSKIPFLSDKKTDGLNFPVQIASTNSLYVGQLDANQKPLHYKEGIDFKKLSEIKALFDKKDYAETANMATLALQTFPTSIFHKDFLLYQIRALSRSSSKEDLDTMISSALEWLKESSSDKHAPEILYILANTYIKNRLNSEAYYYYKRIIDEYPQTDWSALAKMQIAKYLSDGKPVNSTLFPQAYKEAKSQDVKDEILIAWGTAMISEDKKEAISLIESVLKQNKQYFSAHPDETLILLKTLVANELFDLASKIGSHLLQTLPTNEDRTEQLAFDLGQWYALAENTKEAHQYNQLFLTRYPNSERVPQVIQRDNQLLFKMGKNLNDDEKIAVLDKIIATYPQSKEAQEAYLKKAQLLFDLQRYTEVLALQEFIPSSPILAKSKAHIIIKLLENKQCKEIPQYFTGSDLGLFDNGQKLDLFDCLFSLSLYQDAQTLIQNPQETQEKLPWLYRSSKLLKEKAEFSQSRLAGEDTLELARTLNQAQYYDIAFTLFDDYLELKLSDQAQKLTPFLQEHFGQDKRMLEVWYALLKQAQDKNDQNALEIYAKEILKLQDTLKISDYTPNVNFILIYSLMQTKQYQEAKNHLASLLKQKLSPQDLQKTLYMQGSILKALGEDYQQSFQNCLKIEENTSWRDLCAKSL